MVFFNQAEALYQQVEHGDAARGRIALELTVEFDGYLEVERLRFTGLGPVEVGQPSRLGVRRNTLRAALGWRADFRHPCVLL